MSAASNSDQVSTFCLSDRDRDPRTRTRQNLVDPCQGKSVGQPLARKCLNLTAVQVLWLGHAASAVPDSE